MKLKIIVPLLVIALLALGTVAVVMINAGSDQSTTTGNSNKSGDKASGGLTGAFQGLWKPEVTLTGPGDEQLAEGQEYDVTWDARRVDNVTLVAIGDRTSFQQSDKGRFTIDIARDVPADQGSVKWKVPFIDAATFKIEVKGRDRGDKRTLTDSKAYTFRPDIFAKRHDDGIYIDVRKESRQRMYVLENDMLKRAYLTSGSRTNAYLPRNEHPKRAHDHDGVFQVEEKYKLWHSTLFDVPMYWAMRYWGGHYIHGTDPDVYDQLGTPASSGCNRLTKEQAKELYDMMPVGTRVEIIAK